ncbi:MAG: hypothetical protein HC842_04020 [Cytophagales bacterium]|nr:hypothetical protein [Cytophagales bacterium]
MKKVILSLLLLCAEAACVQAQSQFPHDTRINLLFGLNQPLLGGFNVEGNWFYRRLGVDYSHGMSLHMGNAMLDEPNQAQGLAVYIPGRRALA